MKFMTSLQPLKWELSEKVKFVLWFIQEAEVLDTKLPQVSFYVDVYFLYLSRTSHHYNLFQFS